MNCVSPYKHPFANVGGKRLPRPGIGKATKRPRLPDGSVGSEDEESSGEEGGSSGEYEKDVQEECSEEEGEEEGEVEGEEEGEEEDEEEGDDMEDFNGVELLLTPEEEIAKLSAEVAGLHTEISRLRALYEPSLPSLPWSMSTNSPSAGGMVVKRPENFEMTAILPEGLDTLSESKCFKRLGVGFPHAAKQNRSGGVFLLVEKRLVVRVAFELRETLTGKALTESDLPCCPKFRLDVVHAADENPVRFSDFKKMPTRLIEGLDDVTSMTQVMNGGKVQFCFKLGFLSTQSKGDGNYKFKLTCATPALSMHPLEATTPAWKCISREIKKRGGVSAGSAGSAGSGAIIL